jgi:membrane associated rhomboid family serine protease
MRASDQIRAAVAKFAKYLHSEWRRTFSIEYQRAELKKWTRLFRVPPVGTLVLCCLTMGAFVVQARTGELRWVQLYGTLPPSPDHLSALVRTEPGQLLPVWLTLLSYLFVHGSWDHVVSNTVAGWAIGNLAERRFGTPWFLLAYFAGGVIGAFGMAWLLPGLSGTGPRYGASLAWCYVLGAYWALLAWDKARSNGHAVGLLCAEAATLILLGCRFAIASTPSRLESVLWVHPLAIVFGWLSVRIWSGGRRASQVAYERTA